jgi:hypothetical protein
VQPQERRPAVTVVYYLPDGEDLPMSARAARFRPCATVAAPRHVRKPGDVDTLTRIASTSVPW